MEPILQYKIYRDPKFHKYLLENSEWYKLLNRNPNNYEAFIEAMKIKYRLRITDKISDTIDNIDLISNVLNTIK